MKEKVEIIINFIFDNNDEDDEKYITELFKQGIIYGIKEQDFEDVHDVKVNVKVKKINQAKESIENGNK